MIEVHSYPKRPSSRFQRLAYEAVERLSSIESNPKAIEELRVLEKGDGEIVTSSFRVLRNLSLISYPSLFSTIRLLHEVSASEFSVTELGRYVLDRMGY